MNELIWRGEFDEDTSFAMDVAWYRLDNGTLTANLRRSNADARSLAVYLRHALTPASFVSLRADGFSNERFGLPRKFRMLDVSIALGFDLARDLTFTLEVRRDHSFSGNDVFRNAGGSGIADQDTVTGSFLLRF